MHTPKVLRQPKRDTYNDFVLFFYIFKMTIFTHDPCARFLYHGSPIIIEDRYMASETYFTEDIEIARMYGRYIYTIEMNDKLREIMQLDCLGEHFVTNRLIPMYLFTVQEIV